MIVAPEPRPRRLLRSAFVAWCATAAASFCSAQDVAGPAIGAVLPHVKLFDGQGGVSDATPPGDAPAVVLVWFHTACPVARASLPEIVSLRAVAAEKGVPILLIDAHEESPESVQSFLGSRAPGFAAHFDPHGAAARAYGVTRVPTALIVDRARRLRYRGRVFERFTGRDEGPPVIGRLDLRRALEDLMAGRDVAVPETRAVGCLVPAAPESRPRTPLTYYRDVAPIVARHCTDCHRAGGPAPMPLTTYRELRPYVRDVAEVAWDDMMPPWREDGHGLPLKGVRRISDTERNVLVRWVQGGAPAGEPPETAPPTASSPGTATAPTSTAGPASESYRAPEPPAKAGRTGWLPAFDVPAFGAPYEATLEFSADVSAPIAVRRFDLRSDADEIIKRIVLRRSGDGALLSVATPGGPRFDAGPGGAWILAPGDRFTATVFIRPSGIASKVRLEAWWIPAEVDPAPLPASAPTREGAPEKVVVPTAVVSPRTIVLRPTESTISADDSRATFVAEAALPEGATFLAFLPELRHLGSAAFVDLVFADGRTKRLAGTGKWDPRLRNVWAPASTFVVPAGARLRFTAVYDNSAANRRNPSRPPVAVPFGNGPLDEACRLEVVLR